MSQRVMLDLFCGRLGWSKAFLARGWKVIAVDVLEPDYRDNNLRFVAGDVSHLYFDRHGFFFVNHHCEKLGHADFICASSPCEEFSKFGLACFYPDPPYPETGIRLFNHTRGLLWRSGAPWVMENVQAAQKFVGPSTHHCGPFHLWGTGVPPLTPQGIRKGLRLGKSGYTGEEQKEWRRRLSNPSRNAWSGSESRRETTSKIAEIPPELANCVADYAERLLEQRACEETR